MAVALVVLAIAMLLVLRGHPTSSDAESAVVSPSATPQPQVSTAVPTPKASAVSTVIPGPSATRRPAVVPVSRAPLTVLNNSTIEGLAASAAARFAAAGWKIAAVGGIRGRYRFTTLYYAPGQLDAARLLLREFPEITVLSPRSTAPLLPGTGLTVVVTKDFR